MTCNRCLQEIIEGESFWEDEAEGTAYHNDCRRAAIDRRNKAEDERAAALARAEAAITESNSAARRAFSAEVENQRLTKEAAGLRARAEAAEAERDEWKAAYADNELYCLAVMQRRDRALARAEAAITESNSAARRAFNAEVENQRLTKEAAGLRARVAELEAQLAAAHLNPYNTAPLGEHVIVTLRTKGWRDEDGLWDWDDYGDWDVVGWQPLPPAPDMEPTP